MAPTPHRRLATFDRGTSAFTVAIAAPATPDDDGQTPAIVLTEVGSRGRHEIVIQVHELERVARLLADAQRLLATADPAPDPADVISRRNHRAFLERRTAMGDPNARAALAALGEAEDE